MLVVAGADGGLAVDQGQVAEHAELAGDRGGDTGCALFRLIAVRGLRRGEDDELTDVARAAPDAARAPGSGR